MKIDSSYKPNVSPPVNTPQKPPAPPAAPAGDAVSLSTLAGTLGAAERPAVNSVRIQEIKDAIAQGKFKINPEAIADRLIESASELVRNAGQRQA